MKKVLITGANSYIGENVKEYLLNEPDIYDVQIKDTLNWIPKPEDFFGYDVVFNVAGIAHIKETKQNRNLYFDVNRDLVIKIAQEAKKGGVKHFILLSSMSVYGLTIGHITKDMPVKPVNAYGKSKAEADIEIRKLEDDSFKFACLRPPMVYGKNCKGNYQSLRKFAIKSPVFPDFSNQRSMVYILNLCDFIKNVIDNDMSGLFFPQNSEYVNTSCMVELIAKEHNRKIRLTRVFNWAIKLFQINVIKKVFGNLTYEQVDLIDKYSFSDSIIKSERMV